MNHLAIFAYIAAMFLRPTHENSSLDFATQQIDNANDFQCSLLNNANPLLNLHQQANGLTLCLNKYIETFAPFRGELEQAKEYGAMDEVLVKYCNKFLELNVCFVDFLNKTKLCLGPEAGHELQRLWEAAIRLKDFMCERAGYRISIFIITDGEKCVVSKSPQVQSCYGHFINTLLTIRNITLPRFTMDKDFCRTYHKFRTCVVDELANCKRSTPASVVESGFKIVKKSLGCSNASTTDLYYVLLASLLYLIIK